VSPVSHRTGLHPAANRTLAHSVARANFVAQTKLQFGQPSNAWRDHFVEDELKDDVLGPVFEGDHPYVVGTEFHNFKAAVNKRVNYKTELSADQEILDAGMHLLGKKFPVCMNTIEWNMELFEAWNASNPPTKAKAMVEAIDGFMRYTDKEFGRKEVFQKIEALLKRHKGEEWAGRIVNASSDLHNALSGPILNECLKRMNQTLSDDQQFPEMMLYIQYAKDSRFCSDRMNNGEHEFIAECDFSENDMRQCKDVQPLEAKFLSRLGAPNWLIKCMNSANVYTVSSRMHNFKGTVKYQLPSGSTSTTFRNSIWNMSIFWAWKLKHRCKGVAFFLGDDMVAKITRSSCRKSRRGRKDASRSYEHMSKRARMKAKVKVHTHLMEAEFLSKNFVPSIEYGCLMIPKIGKAFARFSTRANLNAAISDKEYMAGKSLSYAWEFRFIKEVRDACILKSTLQQVDLSTLKLEHFSYNFRREVERVGSIVKVLKQLNSHPTLSFYDIENFCQVRYKCPWDDILEIICQILAGTNDVPEIAYASMASRDYW